ncbi:hypothetical protein Ndes2437B_g01294 [Nannochloris sp. 'desiccata']
MHFEWLPTGSKGYNPCKGRIAAMITKRGAARFLTICVLLSLGAIISSFGASPAVQPSSTAIQLKLDLNSNACHRNWDSLPNRKVAVVQFISKQRIEQFVTSWPNHEDRLLRQTYNSSLLFACPHTDFEIIEKDIVDRFKWSFVEQFDHSHPFANGPLLHYKTLGNVDILLQPMNLHLPGYFLQKPQVPTCHKNRTWSLSYALYSGSVFSYHIIHLPVLKKFDYFLKVDTDIDFLKNMPFDIGEELTKGNCLIGHSKLARSTDCEDESLTGVLQATEALHLEPPKSGKYSWCNQKLANLKPSVMFYGNFAAFSTHNLLLHPHVQRLSSYLYEDFEDGYYAHRWGDQAPFVMYTCYLLDIPDIENDPKVCDMSFLRDSVFKHS